MLNSNSLSDTFKRYDFSLFGGSLAIVAIGILNLHSATHADTAISMQRLYVTQSIWLLIALCLGFFVSFISPKTLMRISYPLYLINVFLLVMVLVVGHTGMGAQRWLSIGPIKFQPSETMKLTLVLALSRYFTKVNPEKELGFKELIIPGIIAGIPIVLTIVQPDLGTGILLSLIFASIVFYKRIKWKTIFILMILAIIGSVVMYKFGLKEYQRKRIITFIDPTADAKGSGYNAIQSTIAIGSGRFLGKGYKKSSQGSLQFLPENHTDFVFSVFNEEHGFFGSVVLISLYLILLLRFIWLASSIQLFYESLVTIGLMSIFFWHTFINMGMVMGLMPIVGVPLPLMSYGGSSMITFYLSIGIATGISNIRSMFN